MWLSKRQKSREEKKYKIIGILFALIIASISIFIFFRNFDLNYYNDFLKNDIVGFVVHIVCLAIACLFAYATIGLIVYVIISWLIAVIIYYFSRKKSKEIKKEAERYLFGDDEYDDF